MRSLWETPVMPEAPVRKSRNGLVVDGEGWFVVNAREARWKDEGLLGSYCNFEGKRRFPHFGINVSVLEPGERVGMYHREKAQEAFLVLSGECTLIVEGKEGSWEWDFFYCPPETEHIIVAAAEQSAILLAVGARGRAVAGGWFTRSVRRRRGTEPVSCARPRTPPLPTPRSGRNYLGLGLLSTAPPGYQGTTERPLRGMRLGDFDLYDKAVTVLGKGKKRRRIPISPELSAPSTNTS